MHFKRNISKIPQYFDKYIALIPDEINLISGLKKDIFSLNLLTELESIADKAYAPDKWTVKQCLQHISDTERIFQYRALRISRNDSTPLPGFDENNYAAIANVDKRTFKSLVDELIAVRQSTILLFESLDQNELNRVGNCSNTDISVLAIGFTIIGHQLHHEKIFIERYL